MKKLNLKTRINVLWAHKIAFTIYIVLCIAIIIGLTAVPLTMWMRSGVEYRGMTIVRGDSMEPTLDDNTIMYYQPLKMERGEIVVVECPYVAEHASAHGAALLKRIIGLPGENIKITPKGIMIDDVLLDEPYCENVDDSLLETNTIDELVLSDYEYFILGDNRASSFDSRHVGEIHQQYFMYGLTLEPNEYTYKIWNNVVMVAAANLICVLVLPVVLLVFFTCNYINVRNNRVAGDVVDEPTKKGRQSDNCENIKTTRKKNVNSKSKKNIKKEKRKAALERKNNYRK